MKNKKYCNRQGFTLIEIMVVVVIIAVLTVVGMVSYSSINKNSRDAKRKSDIEQIRSALEMYRTDMGYYPTSGNAWIDTAGLTTYLTDEGYISAIPTDPSNVSYKYRATTPSAGTPTYYYGYCLEAVMENNSLAVDQCVGETGYNYTIKNP